MTRRESRAKESAGSVRKPAATGIFGTLKHAVGFARNMVVDLIDLAALETRRAGLTLMWLIALGVIAGLLLLSTWVALMALLALWIASLGGSWLVAVGSVAALNLLLAVITIAIALRLSRNLTFPTLRRQLRKFSSLD